MNDFASPYLNYTFPVNKLGNFIHGESNMIKTKAQITFVVDFSRIIFFMF